MVGGVLAFPRSPPLRANCGRWGAADGERSYHQRHFSEADALRRIVDSPRRNLDSKLFALAFGGAKYDPSALGRTT